MKPIAMLGLAFAMSPTLVAAQQSSTPDAAPMPRPNFAQMQQTHEQMEQIHLRARAAILSSISPAHRALLANVVGQLAIAPNPDRAAAARALDAALSQGEARSILSTETAAHAQERTLMDSARTQFEASLTPDQRAQMQAHMAARGAAPNAQMPQRTPDAGRTLLEMAMGGGEHHFGMMGGPPGAPPAQ